MASITRLMLIIAAFTCDLSEQNVKQSIESVKIAHIKKWSDENIPMSLFKKIKVLLSA
jgi:ABC-type proline/glycine betaine transport system substrate-binding protein